MIWTTAQAAEACGLSVGAFRTLAARARRAGRDLRAPARTWPDRRTPLYDAEAVFAELSRRPGRGHTAAAPGRYAQCDDTCTTDCGHCKGAGPPDRPISDAGEQLAVEP